MSEYSTCASTNTEESTEQPLLFPTTRRRSARPSRAEPPQDPPNITPPVPGTVMRTYTWVIGSVLVLLVIYCGWIIFEKYRTDNSEIRFSMDQVHAFFTHRISGGVES